MTFDKFNGIIDIPWLSETLQEFSNGKIIL